MTMIERIHWGQLGSYKRGEQQGLLFSVWPEPIDADDCFKDAGFERFEDSDAAWDADFTDLVERAVATFGRYGMCDHREPPILASVRNRWLHRTTTLGPTEHLDQVANDDRLPPCHLAFGAPPRASIFASDGHPLLWIWLHREVAGDWHAHLAALAGSRQLIESSLQWESLLPKALPFHPVEHPGKNRTD